MHSLGIPKSILKHQNEGKIYIIIQICMYYADKDKIRGLHMVS